MGEWCTIHSGTCSVLADAFPTSPETCLGPVTGFGRRVRLFVEPARRAGGLRRSFRLAALQGLHLAPPPNTARRDGSTAEPRIKPGDRSEGEPR